jgi:hypothetical protein
MKARRFLATAAALAVLAAGGCSSDDDNPLTLVIPGIDAESGSVWQDGVVFGDVAAAGDSVGSNLGIRGFVSFDITTIPAGARIVAAALDLSNYTIRPPEQDPFLPPNPLGNFQVFAQNVGALDGADYNAATYAVLYNAAAGGLALGSIDATAALAGARTSGFTRFAVRLQFATQTNGDGIAQLARFDDARARLVVEYE